MKLPRPLRPLLIGVLLVLASQPVGASPLAPAYPAQFTLLVQPGPGPDPTIGLIGGAHSRLLVETYALNDPPIVAALAAARGRGVDVRVMADPHSATSGAILDQLAGRDVWVRRGNPAFAHTGQSALVIDQDTLVVSNAPLTIEARTGTQRFLVVDHDPVDVRQAASVFYDDWERRAPNRFGDQTVLAPPDYQTDAITAINEAARTLDVLAGTLTSQAMIQALEGAALRQVKVRLLIGPGTAADAVQALGAAGATIRLLNSPFVGSALAVDTTRLLIGSADLSDVSLQQQRELGLLFDDPTAGATFAQAFAADWAAATKVAAPTLTPTTLPSATTTPTIPTLHVITPGTFTRTPTVRPGTPTRTPTPTRTAAPPTPTFVPTATPSVLTLTPSYASSVRIGGTQQIVVRTIPGAAVTITVTYPDGSTHNPGTSQGVGVADATGSFVDTWTVSPSTAPGTARALITVSAIGKTRSVTISFNITL